MSGHSPPRDPMLLRAATPTFFQTRVGIDYLTQA